MLTRLGSRLDAYHRRTIALALVATAMTAGCSERASDTASAVADVWRVGEEPELQIGIAAGDEPYQLHRVTSAARLGDGGVVVANAGSAELRFFDSAGRFVRAVGRRGDGPGEWRGPDRVRRLEPDSLLVLDTELGRRDVLAGDGSRQGGTPIRSDVIFPWDHWVHGPFVVDSPLAPEERGIVARALDRIAGDGESDAARLARVTPAGRIWATDWVSENEPVDWAVYDLDGRRVALVTTPARFELYDQGEDWVLGVQRDSLDVEHVVLYPLDRMDSPYEEDALARAVQGWVGPAPSPLARVSPAAYPDLNSGLKRLASLQEIHYSQRFTYSTSLDSLLTTGTGMSSPLAEGVAFEPLRAGPDGWAARLVRDGDGCMITYGRFGLLGVRSGSVLCWGRAAEGGVQAP